MLFDGCSVCACLDLSVSSSSLGLGRAAVCDCGTPWTFLLPFLLFAALWFIPRGNLFYFVLFCSCVFQSFYHCDNLACERES